jgi:hypothetical protein
MRQYKYPGLSFMDLPRCGAVDIEELADATLGVFNLASPMLEKLRRCR